MFETYKPIHHFFRMVVLFLTVLTVCSCSVEKETDAIAQWRGENRDGIYDETNLLNQWPVSGPDLLWVVEGIGKGYAAPSITDTHVFVNGEKDSVSYLFCFDTRGNLIWEKPNGKEFMGEGFSATYSGSRSTPTVVGKLVYTTSGKGRIACFEADTGTEKWAVDIVNDLGGLDNFFGYSESVVVDDGKVYCFPGGIKNNTVALDAHSGKIVWSAEAMKDTFSYCSPILVELNQKKVLLTHSRHHLYTLDCENGDILSSYFIAHYEYDGEHCNSPLFSNGAVYFIGNEKDDGAVKLTLSENGEDLVEVWRNIAIKNNFNGYVQVNNSLYSMVKGNWLKAINIDTGIVSDSVKASTGSIIYADHKFYCYGMNGDFNLITHDENRLSVISSFKVEPGTGHHFSHPVIKNGVLYIRHGNALMAYKINN